MYLSLHADISACDGKLDHKSYFDYLYYYTKHISLNKYDLENIKDDKETVKTLKKINPYYFLDMLN